MTMLSMLATMVVLGAVVGFKKATKAQAKLRAAFFGPSGAGKTFTSLRAATGLAGGGPVAVIDTERGSASKYSDRFEFDVLELEDKSVQGYVDAIRMAGAAGYSVLVIDSLSHAWETLCEEVEKLAKAKYRGNTWSAWSEGTPLQRKLISAILDFPGHIIVTMRSKTEWTTVEDKSGRKAPQRVGLSPQQGKSIEYEFDLLLELTAEHIGTVIKDRTGKFQDRLIDKPGEDFGRELAAWLADGVPAAPRPESYPPPARKPDADTVIARAEKAIATAADLDAVEKVVDYCKGVLSETQLERVYAIAATRLDQLPREEVPS
jgi:hypothetical protein